MIEEHLGGGFYRIRIRCRDDWPSFQHRWRQPYPLTAGHWSDVSIVSETLKALEERQIYPYEGYLRQKTLVVLAGWYHTETADLLTRPWDGDPEEAVAASS